MAIVFRLSFPLWNTEHISLVRLMYHFPIWAPFHQHMKTTRNHS